MSFDTYREDNEDNKGTTGASAPQGSQTPNPYGFPHPSQSQAPTGPAPTYGAAPAPQNPANPYGFPHPSQNQAPPSPAPAYGAPPIYGASPAPQNPYAPQGQNPNQYPYGAPQGQVTPPQSPYASAPQQGNPAAQSPYSFNGYQQAQPAAPTKGITVFGLTWAKNLIPNPATGGMPVTQAKSNVVAYVLWFFFGWLGGHQFYLGNTNRGLFNLTLFFFTMVLSFTSIPFSLIYTAYWIYEAVVLNDQTNEVNHGYIRKSIL